MSKKRREKLASRSLFDLFGHWDLGKNPSPLEVKFHASMSKAPKDLSPGEIQLFLSQKAFLDHILPFALNLAETDPWVEGRFYPGDISVNLLVVEIESVSDPDIQERLRRFQFRFQGYNFYPNA